MIIQMRLHRHVVNCLFMNVVKELSHRSVLSFSRVSVADRKIFAKARLKPRLHDHAKFNARLYCATHSDLCKNDILESDFNPKNCGVMRKVTRYEYEKQLNPSFSEEQLKAFVSLAVLLL